ncbi:MAG: hypothetical protein AAGJ52_03735 [Pseudomonadota bacterium]
MIKNFARAGLMLAAFSSTTLCLAGGSNQFIFENFEFYGGNGYVPNPGAGQLDSDRWRVTGFSDGDGSFGGTHDTGDFARGSSPGDVVSGGAYAFSTGGNIIQGIQPTGSDFTPGAITARLINGSGSDVSTLEVSYQVWTLNNADRANTLNLEYSLDDVTYVPVPEANFTTPGTADSPASWAVTDRMATITGLSLAANGEFFLRWSGDDSTGGGGRDEYGIDNVSVIVAEGPDVEIQKVGPAFAVAGEQITYQIDVENLGVIDDVTGLLVIDDLPANTTYISDSSGVVPDLSSPGSVLWNFPDLPAGNAISFELVLAIDPAASGSLFNDVLATGQVGTSPVNVDATWETTLVPDVSIYEVQTPVDVSVDDASPFVGQIVRVDGIVTAAPNEIGSPATAVIQEAGGGPYSGLRVIGNFSSANPQRGDEIRVIGVVTDPFGLTQLSFNEQIEFIQTATELAPQPLATSEFDQTSAMVSEQWESVLIEFTDVIITNENPDAPDDFDEWLFSDGSGDARGDAFSTSLTINPSLNDEYLFLRGIGWFSFNNYKLQPRNNDDFGRGDPIYADRFEQQP